MSIQNEIMNAVNGALSDAMEAARDVWAKTPELANTAMLTGTAADSYCDSAAGELTFETHHESIPQSVRDRYGVTSGTRAARLSRSTRVSPEKLMQETGDVMEAAFADSLDIRLS